MKFVKFAWPLASIGLLFAAFFPFDLGWLGWIAWVPLLSLVDSPMPRWSRYLLAYIVGLGFYAPVLSWIRVADDMMVYSWLALSLYISCYFPLTIYLLRRLQPRTGWPIMLLLPLVAVPLEWVRSRLAGGFAWYLLGHTQHAALPIIQFADVTGALGISALVYAINGCAYDLLRAYRAGQLGRFRTHAAIALGLLVVTAGYGTWRMGSVAFTAGPRVALLQGNLPQNVRNEATLDSKGRKVDAATLMMEHFKELSDRAAGSEPKPDLIVWPETSWVYEWWDVDPSTAQADVPPPYLLRLKQQNDDIVYVAKQHWKVPTLLGINTQILMPPGQPVRHYNSALLIDRTGQRLARYDKIHRVPFGEYVPYVELFPWLMKLTPYGGDSYSVQAGDRFERMQLDSPKGKFLFGNIICYEDSDDLLARNYVGAEPKVDFLVNLSNDGWFKGTWEHEQHLAVSRFRAVECRRSLVRAVNMGISAVIDSNGTMVTLPGPSWAQSKAVSGVVIAEVPIDRRFSFFALAGDWFPIACTLGLFGVWIGTRNRSASGV